MASSVTVTVKNQGKKFKVEIDPATTGDIFKCQLFSLTGVEPERQKVIVRNVLLSDDAIMGEVGLTDGQTLVMMGTPASEGLVRPDNPTKFVEDMTDKEVSDHFGGSPAGLFNLGNSCYLNSTLQVLRTVTEVREAVLDYVPGQIGRQEDMIASFQSLFRNMSAAKDATSPAPVLDCLRLHHGQFAEKTRSGHFAQQDAEEAWTQVLATLGEQFKRLQPGASVERFLAGEMTYTIIPAPTEVGAVVSSGCMPFTKLSCYISGKTNHMQEGIRDGLVDTMEIRGGLRTRTARISRLPKYLTVHFVRFYWKPDIKKHAKILRKVTFPLEFDAVDLCVPELAARLAPARDALREVRRITLDMERARKTRKPAGNGGGSNNNNNNNGDASRSSPEDKKAAKRRADPKKGDAAAVPGGLEDEVDAERRASLIAATEQLHSMLDPSADDAVNQTGLFELCGVVSHQGPGADSGHYTAFVKKTPAQLGEPVGTGSGAKGAIDRSWWWINDSRVSEVGADRIEGLAGGGEAYSALILLYRAVPLPNAQ